MAAPTRDGNTALRNAGTPAGSFDISAIPVGSWMIIQAQMGTTGITLTTPSGWTPLIPVNTAMGSRQVSLWGRVKQSGDTTVTLTKSGSSNAAFQLAWGSGADPVVTNWIVGTFWKRDGTATTEFYTKALSVNVLTANSLGLAFSWEATNTAEGSATVTSGAGWANWYSNPEAGSNVEQLRCAYQVFASTGASGDETDTYPNLQLTNAAGIQVILPPVVTNVAPTAGFSSSAANLVLTVTSTATDSDGTIASTDYNWGDGTTHGNTANGTHTYSAAGTYTVTQTVTDNSGASSNISHNVTVTAANISPTPGFTITRTGDKSVSVTSSATDGDGTIASTSYNWGDGVTNGSSTHTYSVYGTYTITQTVTDNLGATGSVNHSAVISAVGMDVLLRLSDGTNKAGKMFYFDGTTKHADIQLGKTYQRVFTISELLDEASHGPWFTMHRVGSYSYPEHTLYGGQGCVDAGAHILEVSMQKSSSGTFWGFHDATVDRTVVGQTGNVSSFTDTQLASFMEKGSTALGNSTQPSRPTAKAIDIFNAFPNACFFVEDKTYLNTAAMLNLLDANGGPDRFVVKIDATSGPSIYDQAAARGYTTWGYVFADHMDSTNLTSILAKTNLNMLGMDFAASDAVIIAAIAQTIAAGKRPTGHIIATQAQRDRMLGFGLTGLMLSNKLLLPNLIPLP